MLFKMVFASVLIALIILMTFTGIGYIPIGPLKLTLNVLPVAVGAVVLGPAYGALLGLVFGLSSFFTCFGLDALGTIFLGINPFLLFVMCVVPRILCGWIPALVFKAISGGEKASGKREIIGSSIACALTAIVNTVGFLSLMWLFFAQDLMTNPKVLELLGGVSVNSIVTLFVTFAGVNALVEVATCLILGTAVCKALLVLMKKSR